MKFTTSLHLPGSRGLRLGLFLITLVCLLAPAYAARGDEGPVTFEIDSFIVEGNTLLSGKAILDLLGRYKGGQDRRGRGEGPGCPGEDVP